MHEYQLIDIGAWKSNLSSLIKKKNAKKLKKRHFVVTLLAGSDAHSITTVAVSIYGYQQWNGRCMREFSARSRFSIFYISTLRRGYSYHWRVYIFMKYNSMIGLRASGFHLSISKPTNFTSRSIDLGVASGPSGPLGTPDMCPARLVGAVLCLARLGSLARATPKPRLPELSARPGWAEPCLARTRHG